MLHLHVESKRVVAALQLCLELAPPAPRGNGCAPAGGRRWPEGGGPARGGSRGSYYP